MQQKRVLADITNYTPTALKDITAPSPQSEWCKLVPVPENKRRTMTCIKAEEFDGSSASVTSYIVEEASAGRFWNIYLTEKDVASKNNARERNKKEKLPEPSKQSSYLSLLLAVAEQNL